MRENVATTSAELNAVPSWNFTPSRSLKVYVLPSGDAFQLSARSGMIVLRPSAGLKRTRLLYIWPRMKRNAPWWTSKCATSAGPAHLSTPPRLGLGSAARARSERTAARAGAGCFSDHAVSAAPAVVPAAVLRKRRRFTLRPRRGWSMSRALLWVGTRLPYARDQRSSTGRVGVPPGDTLVGAVSETITRAAIEALPGDHWMTSSELAVPVRCFCPRSRGGLS